tara:strand:- start:68 stop:433 length:366 start_codon:yes stop_codon:yes gene_type:complete
MLLIDTYLDKSEIHGVGVFSKENIKKGRKIQEERSNFQMEFDKNNLPSMPLAFSNFLETHSYQKYLHPDTLILQVDNSKYINHSKNPNLNHDGFAVKDIKIGDEITIDYNGFDDNINVWLT